MFVYTIQPVVKPVLQPVVSCKRGIRETLSVHHPRRLLHTPAALPLYHSIITFRVSRRRREIYCGHSRLCVCLSAAACLHYCTDLDVTWWSGRGCPLVVHYWTDLQSVHGLRCYGNITRTRNVSEYKLVLAVCIVSLALSRDKRWAEI